MTEAQLAAYTAKMDEFITVATELATHLKNIYDLQKAEAERAAGCPDPSLEEQRPPLHEEMYQRKMFEEFVQREGLEKIEKWKQDITAGKDIAETEIEREKARRTAADPIPTPEVGRP